MTLAGWRAAGRVPSSHRREGPGTVILGGMSELLGELQDQTFARATSATATSYPPERRLSAAQLASYLDRRVYAVVGSARADGRPHAAMSAYVRRGTTFW